MEIEEPELSTASTFEMIVQKDREMQEQESKRKRLVIYLLLMAIVVVIVVVIIITVVLLVQGQTNDSTARPKTDGSSSNNTSNLVEKFFLKVQESYIDGYPETITTLNVTADEIRARFRPFDYSPAALKKIADRAAKLRSEFATIFTKDVEANLSERELRAIYEMQQLLKHLGGQGPYDTSYYTGVWMLGPNTMVWEPISRMWSWMENLFSRSPALRPSNVKDFEQILHLMSQFKDSVNNYTENMRLGVKTGMVRNIEACKAGLKSFKTSYRDFALHNEAAVLSSGFLRPFFLQKMTSEMGDEWKREHNKNFTSSLKETLLSCVGKPLTALIRYMENEHMRHCVPSNVSSGLASLPLSHVYVDGVPDLSQPTNPFLSTGERLNGRLAFKNILSYYTTTDVTPTQLQEMGYEKLRSLKQQAVSLAQEVTGEPNETVAVEKFRQKLSMQSMYFNNQTFPANESEETTYLKCYNVISAQRYCPKRWKAYNSWKTSTQSIQNVLRQNIKQLFYTTGKKKTTLSCSAAVSPAFHPASSYHSYTSRGCGIHRLPFFIDNYGPEYSEWTVTAHETVPGHNLEVTGYYQNFYKKHKDVIQWITARTYFPAFSEGWATYAEYPLVGKDLDIYKDLPMDKYGMLQQQIMGALRLVIESGLHSLGMSRSAALHLFKQYSWESGDIATKEITRYQSVQGHSVSYIVGQTAFLKARAFVEKELGNQFSLKEFHYQVLRQGEVPLGYLQKSVERYVKCTKTSDDNTTCK